MKNIWFVLFILLAPAVFFYFVFAPIDQNSEKSFTIEIQEGESSKVIAGKLHTAGLIRSGSLFRLYAALTGRARNLQAGVYEFSRKESVAEIIDKISRGKTAAINLTVPEGFSIKDIEEKFRQSCLEKSFYCQVNLGQLKAGQFKTEFPFLENVPDENSLEGFLFPETYIFNLNDDGSGIAKKMLGQFSRNTSQEFAKVQKGQGSGIYQMVIMASLLEKEVRTFEDKKLVSGILWKRLRSGMPLQVDATISYITGRKTTKISLRELQIDSPYNTYKYKDLPPGPISNPGLESIKAALEPKDSPYWFYLSAPDGATIFSQNYQEHLEAKNRHLP